MGLSLLPPFLSYRLTFSRAVRRTTDGLIEAHGELADLEAWRVLDTPDLDADELAFCRAVAVAVSRSLGRAPEQPRRWSSKKAGVQGTSDP